MLVDDLGSRPSDVRRRDRLGDLQRQLAVKRSNGAASAWDGQDGVHLVSLGHGKESSKQESQDLHGWMMVDVDRGKLDFRMAPQDGL